jgi:hypothetical protein
MADEPRLAQLVRRARALRRQRDKLVEELARDWAAALRGQGFSPGDLDELWAGLTEEAVARLRRAPEAGSPEAIRREATEVIARVRERVEAALGVGG